MSSNPKNEPIAIIGTGVRFPGGASTPSKLWELLKEPRDVVQRIPASRWDPTSFYHEDGEHHGATNAVHGYLLEEDHRTFDHQFFSIQKREAESIDPQQRLLLETVYEGVEAAGYSIEQLRGSQTAVFVGMMNSDYQHLLMRDLDNAPQYLATGTSIAIVSNRVSYFFDWRGPSSTVDTACSSSIVALHSAVQSLRSGETDLAVAAGVNMIIGPEPYIMESKLHMLSPTGGSRMWDSKVDGYTRGEAIASVILKPLSKAIADNDNIECIIRETGVNQDGRTKGITMPSPEAQAALIRATYKRAGLDLNKAEDRPQYFEGELHLNLFHLLDTLCMSLTHFKAHGTGTPAGDPREAEAISSVFFPNKENPFGTKLTVGSIKTIVGHTEGTAGLAGVMKAMLAMKNGTIPPNLHFDSLNPTILPFYDHLKVATEKITWPELPAGVPKRASVNSFGFGGTNGHAILEAYEPEIHAKQATGPSGPFVLSANTSTALAGAAKQLSEHLKTIDDINLTDLAYTLSRRGEFPYKAAFSGLTKEQLIEKLDAATAAPSMGTRASPLTKPLRILGIFTGQGAQWPAMGAKLYAASALFRERIDEMEVSLNSLPDAPAWSLTEQILAGKDTSRIHEAALSQPLCTALQVALIDLLKASNITFSAVVGHSSGEIGAAYAAGFVDSPWDAIRIAYYRGVHAPLARGPQGQKGMMMAVGMSYDEAQRFCATEYSGRIAAAASNASSSVTLSGDEDAIKEAQKQLDERGTFARLLKVDTAYHSHHMQPCAQPYYNSLRACELQILDGPTQTNWYSSVFGTDGRKIPDLESLKGQYWVDNMVQSVLFSQALYRALTEEEAYDMVLEVGPHPALKGPAMDSLSSLASADIPYTGVLSRGADDLNSFSDALGFIYSNFLTPTPLVNFAGFRTACVGGEGAGLPAVIKGLPCYSWDHDKILWKESQLSKAWRTRTTEMHELLGTCTPNGANNDEMRWRNNLKVGEIDWVRGHAFQGQVLFPAAGYISMAYEAATRISSQPTKMVELHDLTIQKAITLDEDSSGTEINFTIKVTARTESTIEATYSCYSRDIDATENDVDENTNFTGKVIVTLGEPDANVLPTRVAPKLPMDPVNIERLYQAITEIDLQYTMDFKIETAQRRLNRSVVTMKRLHKPNLRVHPATLDAGFHGIFAAFSSPGDGRLWTTYLPTSIERVRINTACVSSNTHSDAGLIADCIINSGDAKAIKGDVDIFCAADGHAEIQLQGLVCSSFTNPRPEDDRKFYAQHTWVRDLSSGIDPERRAVVTTSRAKLAELADRSAYFYIRALAEQFSPMDIAERHLERSFEWMTNSVLPKIEAGQHGSIKAEWASDTKDDVSAWAAAYPESVDLQLINAVGEQLPAIFSGEVSAIEVMMQDDLLDRLYTEGVGFTETNHDLGVIASQLVHRYPRMNVLEIGAGTLGATPALLEAIGDQFGTHTYTDVSEDFADTAKGMFAKYADKFVFKILDIEAGDLKEQGFEEASFDLIIASNSLHATRFLKNTLSNVRSLLKPGGQLIMQEITRDCLRTQFLQSTLPDYFIGLEDGRIWGPTIGQAQWDKLLRETGFSGIDILSTPDFSVWTSQAVDERVNVYRAPLAGNAPRIEKLLIVGGQSSYNKSVAIKAKDLLAPLADTIEMVTSLDAIEAQVIAVPNGIVVLCLADLDSPCFNGMTESRFKAVQKIFLNAKALLWITRGAQADDPDANQIVGLGRSVLLESPGTKLQFLDIGSAERADPVQFAEALVRVVLAGEDAYADINWTLEHEVTFEDGALMIPRVMPNQAVNDRLNSARRTITEEVELKKIAVQLTKKAGGFALEHGIEQTAGQKIAVAASTAYPLTTSDGTSVFVCVGTVVGSTRKVAALSSVNSSIVDVPADATFGLSGLPADASGLHSIVCGLIAESAVACATGKLWIHQPSDLLTQAILDAAARHSINVFLTSSTFSSSARVQYIHPQISERELLAMLPDNVQSYINVDPETAKPLDSLIRGALRDSATVAQVFIESNGTRSLALSFGRSGLREALKTAIKAKRASHDAPVIGIDTVTDASGNLPASTIIDWRSTDKVSLKITGLNHQGMFSHDKTYLLVGLTGDLGLSICDWMASNGARYIVVTSRNPKIHPEIIADLARKGAALRPMALDITNKVALERMVKEIHATMPPIGGVMNGAMVLRDMPLENMTWEDFQVPLAAKVQGSKNLDEVFYSTDLEFFVFFGSIACIIGNPGQSNYGAANIFMTSMAYQRRKRGVAASVVQITMVLGVGYITRSGVEYELQLKSIFEKNKVTGQNETGFREMLGEAIVAGRPGSTAPLELITGVGNSDTSWWKANPRFAHYIGNERGGNDKKKSAAGGESVRAMVAAAIGDGEEAALAALEFGMAKMLENVLQTDADKIDRKLPLSALGIDSLVAVQIRSWFIKELGVDMPVLKILGDNTMIDLCKDCLGRIPDLIGDAAATEAPVDDSAPVDWAKEISELQDGLPPPPIKRINSVAEALATSSTEGLVAVITGATGFLGTHLLRSLIADSRVKEVHAIAIRLDSAGNARQVSVKSPKITTHSGSLTTPRLGLSEETFSSLSRRAHFIIHNAAEVNFMKSYSALKPANVLSTRFLLELAIPRAIPVHFVSTAAVALLTGGTEMAEVAASTVTPPSTGGMQVGYASSKWASEVLLEKVAATHGVPSTIHRSVIIVGEGAPETDLMTVVDKYIGKLRAIPQVDEGLIRGVMDVVEGTDVAKGIAEVALAGKTEGGLYDVVNYCNEFKFGPAEMNKYYDPKFGHCEHWPMERWLDEAAKVGLNPVVEGYFRDAMREKRQLPLPSLRKGSV